MCASLLGESGQILFGIGPHNALLFCLHASHMWYRGASRRWRRGNIACHVDEGFDAIAEHSKRRFRRDLEDVVYLSDEGWGGIAVWTRHEV